MTTKDIVHQRLINQNISSPAFQKPGDVVHRLGAVQAQDYLGALWAVGTRTKNATEDDIEKTIADKIIVRTWPLRCTLHFVAAADVRWMLELLSPMMISRTTFRFRQLELDNAVFTKSKKLFIKALQGNKQLTRDTMYDLLKKARISVSGQRGIHILWRHAQEGLLCFGARMGKQHTFVLLDEWLPVFKTFHHDEALAEIAMRYFISHGPATLQDFIWWSGLTTADARTALKLVEPQLVQEVIEGQTYWFSDNIHVAESKSTVYLLPGFDEYIVGYKNRGAVLDQSNKNRVNSGGGMLSPVIVINGKVAGIWKRVIKKDKVRIEIVPFRQLNKSEIKSINTSITHYTKFLDKSLEEIIYNS